MVTSQLFGIFSDGLKVMIDDMVSISIRGIIERMNYPFTIAHDSVMMIHGVLKSCIVLYAEATAVHDPTKECNHRQ